ncbi:RNA polymerase sigma factor [Chitinophaga defluvii]|uniref:RNA polymerase sigma-70 factor n=1 Tax=Chitinophaga defluvii TaxID=3163343 RepID=A0ABV2TCS1_9BACT
MSDAAANIWLKRVAAGEETAFRHLYDQFSAKVYTMALSYLKSPLEVQDAVQDIFIKVWEKRALLPEVDNFPAWLHVIARNHLINSLRKKIPSNFQQELTHQEPVEDHRLPAQQLDMKEMSQLIREAVEKLSPRQQQVYRMSREQGITLQQIALQLGISYDTVREHMNNALKSIRAYLEEHYGEISLLLWLLIPFKGS